MDFNLTICTNGTNTFTTNNQELIVKEMQKNRLNEYTVENKIFAVFQDIQAYQTYAEDIVSADINYIKLATTDGTIIFERNDIKPEDISIFSNITTNEININIIVFDRKEPVTLL